MDPILGNALSSTITPAPGDAQGTQLPKTGASQFDKVKSQLQATSDQLNSFASQATQPVSASAQPLSTAPAQPAISSAPSPAAGTDATQGATRPKIVPNLPPGPEKLQQTMAAGRYHLDRVQETVKANPSAGTMDKVKGKLTSIESQYNQLDTTLQQISPNASPQDWLRLQQMANSMNENISVLSKLVDSASSGVKTILQTQI